MTLSNQSENDFFSKISHDLRGSFTSILGFSDLLTDPSEKLSEEEINEFVKRIGIQTRDTFELLESFLLWLKLEKFNYDRDVEEINLLEIFIEAQNNFSKIKFQENVSIKNNINNSFYLNTDLRLLQSALTNLFNFIFTSYKKLISIYCTLKISDVNQIIIEANYLSANFNLSTSLKLGDIKFADEFGYSLFFADRFFSKNSHNLSFEVIDQNSLRFVIGLSDKRIK